MYQVKKQNLCLRKESGRISSCFLRTFSNHSHLFLFIIDVSCHCRERTSLQTPNHITVTVRIFKKCFDVIYKANMHRPIVGNCWELRSLVARSNGFSNWLNIFNNVQSDDVNSSRSNFSDCLRGRPISDFSSNSLQTIISRAMKLSIMCRVEFHLVQTPAFSIRRRPNCDDSLSRKDRIKLDRLTIDT